jgi:subtilisin family serine protease
LIDAHGTQVAGVIGAEGGNTTGIVGVNWHVTMIPIKILGSQGGTISNAIKAISYLIELKLNQGINLVAINASWGGNTYSQSLYQAVELAGKTNILFVTAAGNNASSLEFTPYYPASFALSNVVSVASSTTSGSIASFSSFGTKSVDLVAPGVGIYTTTPSKLIASSYAAYSGTSLSAAHVTGAAALYAASQKVPPSVKLLKAALFDSVATQTNLKSKVVTAGRLNIAHF